MVVSNNTADSNNHSATALARPTSMEAVEKALVRGDLSQLTADERVTYYHQVCRSLGLNPLTGPLEYISLGGKLRLYAKRDCADQLRKRDNVTVQVLARDIVDDCLIVHVRAIIPGDEHTSERTDEDMGVVHLGSLKGEARANAIMRAVTKAKRRVTLSICGLGFLDETEVQDATDTRPAAPAVDVRVLPQSSQSPAPTVEPARLSGAVGASTTTPEDAVSSSVARVSPDQLANLRRLKTELQIDDAAWLAAMKKRGVASARDLTFEQADEIIKLLSHRLAVKSLGEGIPGEEARAASQPSFPDGGHPSA